MKMFLNASVTTLIALAVFTSAQSCWAGWGVITCSNNNGACTASHGAGDYGTALNMALDRCNEEYGNCVLEKWEHNQCIDETAANGVTIESCD